MFEVPTLKSNEAHLGNLEIDAVAVAELQLLDGFSDGLPWCASFDDDAWLVGAVPIPIAILENVKRASAVSFLYRGGRRGRIRTASHRSQIPVLYR